MRPQQKVQQPTEKPVEQSVEQSVQPLLQQTIFPAERPSEQSLKNQSTLQQTVRFYLEDMETPIGKTINLMLTGLILLSLAIFIAETYPLSTHLRANLKVCNELILTIFATEYLLRFWSSEDKLKYCFSLYGLIDLLVILPSFCAAIDIRFLRILRWFRILRLLRFVEGKTFFGYVSREDSLIFARILFTLFTIIFVYSGLIYQVEHPINSKEFGTFLDAFYFSVATMTTVGFGDITPVSEVGRLLTVLMIFTGIALIPLQLGDLVKQLVKASHQVEICCINCGLSTHDAKAKFCQQCGTNLGKR